MAIFNSYVKLPEGTPFYKAFPQLKDESKHFRPGWWFAGTLQVTGGMNIRHRTRRAWAACGSLQPVCGIVGTVWTSFVHQAVAAAAYL